MKILHALAAFVALALAPAAMAGICTVTEFNDLPNINGRAVYVMPLYPGQPSQSVDYSSSTQTMTALATTTRYIVVSCDAKAHIAIGTSPTADAEDPAIQEGSWRVFAITQPSTAANPMLIAIYDGTT